MGAKAERIRVTSDSELALSIKRAAYAGESLLVDTGDAVYRLRISPEEAEQTAEPAGVARRPPSAEEVARSREGILKAAGSWKNVDVDAFKAYIAKRRRTSSRPLVGL